MSVLVLGRLAYLLIYLPPNIPKTVHWLRSPFYHDGHVASSALHSLQRSRGVPRASCRAPILENDVHAADP